jgi:hypothetical protein
LRPYLATFFKYSKNTLTNAKNARKIFSRKLGGVDMAPETKRQRFVRLAEARTNKILEMMRLLGNCSSKSNYEYTEDDVRKIFAVLEKELKNTKNRYLGVESKEERFTLK